MQRRHPRLPSVRPWRGSDQWSPIGWPVLDLYGREQVRTERYFFDGVRRVQELFTDPLAADDGDPVDISDEGGGELPPLSTTVYTSREHIYSPGYVDEWVAQVDVTTTADRPAWVLQDANYNVLALVDSQSRVLRQYTYDPYGELLAMDRYDLSGGLPAPFENRVGHQGLFFDRLDAGVLQTQMGVGVYGLYQNRNRIYDPRLGRFVQRDPVGSGLSLQMQAFLGTAWSPSIGSFSLEQSYGDGVNLYNYLGANPTTGLDPAGTLQLGSLLVDGPSRTSVAAANILILALAFEMARQAIRDIILDITDIDDDEDLKDDALAGR